MRIFQDYEKNPALGLKVLCLPFNYFLKND